MMIARALVTLSAAIFLALGSIHLVYTFWGPKLTPRDPALQSRMREVSPVISSSGVPACSPCPWLSRNPASSPSTPSASR